MSTAELHKNVIKLWQRIIRDTAEHLLGYPAELGLNDAIDNLNIIHDQMGNTVAKEEAYSIVCLSGIGTDQDEYGDVYVKVGHWAEYLRGPDGRCAFCGNDDWNDPATPIGGYLNRNRSVVTCPVCEGRPT